MNGFIILDSNRNELLLPKKTELVGVRSYFNDSQSAQEFGDDIAGIRLLLDCKSPKTGIAISDISNNTNNSMLLRTGNSHLMDQIDSHEFEVISGQPSLAARSATLVEAEVFYKQFFGQEFSADPIDSGIVNFDKINSETQFIGHLYADELSLRRKFGVYPGVFEALVTAVRAVNGRQSQDFLDKIAQTPEGIVGLIATTDSGRRAQYFVKPYDKDAFIEAIRKTNKTLDLEDFGKVIASVYCDIIHAYKQRLIRGQIYKTVNLYYNRIENLRHYSYGSDHSAHITGARKKDVQESLFETGNKERIEETPTSIEKKLTLKEKLDALDAFTRENPGVPVSAKVVEIFPELAILAARQSESLSGEIPGSWVDRVGGQPAPAAGAANPLPDVPPAVWKSQKLASDTPPDFIKRHYGPWLRADATGLTRPDIKRLDPSLYMALANWLRKNELPSDCPIPDRTARLDAELTRYLERGIGAIVTGPSDPEHVLREARRIASATQRRGRATSTVATLLESDLPSEAPEIYQGMRSGEPPVEFIRRVYGQWEGRGLDRSYLRQVDHGLYRALYIAVSTSGLGRWWKLPPRTRASTSLLTS